MIFGEPGLEKDNLAALIHYGSCDRREPIIKVNCGKLQASGAELFGREGGKYGLIEALGKGTLIFNNIQELPPELHQPLCQLLAEQIYFPVQRSENTTPQQKKMSRSNYSHYRKGNTRN